MGEQKSFPVRYMVEGGMFAFRVLDTLASTQDVICECCTVIDARKIAKLLNEAEGYRYDLS